MSCLQAYNVKIHDIQIILLKIIGHSHDEFSVKKNFQ